MGREKKREIGRERGREREGEREGERKRDFNETRNCCVTHYDRSVWPSSKDEG